MKKLIKNMVKFALILIGMNYLFFTIVYNIYLKNYETVDLSYSSYILSDSRGYNALNKVIGNKIYNFSAPSDSYQDMLRKIKFLIRKTTVSKIIISVDDHALSPYRNKSNNLDRSSYFSSYNDHDNFLEYIKQKYIKRNVPLVNSKSRGIIKAYLSYKPIQLDEFSWMSTKTSDKISQSISRVKSQFSSVKQSEVLKSTLIQIVEVCKKNRIELIGFKSPISKEYINALGSLNYKSDSIFESYNLKVLDFKNRYHQKDSLFKNSDHLNSLGKEKFSIDILKYEQLFN